MNHECKYRDIYRLIRRYLMLNYPKIANEIFSLTESRTPDEIKKELNKINTKKYFEVYELSRQEATNL